MGEVAVSHEDNYPAIIEGFRRELAEIQTIDAARSIEKQAATLAQAYATVQRSIEKANPLNEIAVEAAAKIGELLGVTTQGIRHDLQLSDACESFDKDSRHRYRKLAKIAADKRREYYDDCNANQDAISQNGTLRYGTGSRHAGLSGIVEWYTPQHIIERVHNVLGAIDIDPASNPIANEVVRAKKIYTEDDDGLDDANQWAGKAFCNPPFSHPTCRYFSERMLSEYQQGNVTEAILLIQANCDLGYWQELARHTIVCLTRGRIKFYRDGESNNPTLGQAIFYFGNNAPTFVDEFRDIGVIIEAVQ